MQGAASFGFWLRERRKSLDLTQEELALTVGCSLETIQKIEGGSRRPSKQMSELLAQSLGVPGEEREALVRFARGDSNAKGEGLQPIGGHGGRLPAQLSPLIGREEETARLKEYLLGEDVRLLTLTGAPGIGKTRLAIEVASELESSFKGGVHFVELAPIITGDLVIHAVADTLGVKEAEGQSLLERVTRYLRDREVLLVLDNFEQVVEAGPVVTELLTWCPLVKVLITSREALNVHGERQFPVPPLKLPDQAQLPGVEDLNRYPAIDLFVRSAQAISPDFKLTEGNAEAVATICARLDGLPLAIELVAARVKLLPPQALLSRLSQRLALSASGGRDLPVRHQTLQNAISWSYDLLEEEEQTLFRRLGVFVGGCTLTSVEAVCNATADLKLEMLEGLALLLDKSLLYQEQPATTDPRFTMLETIREFARERQEESGETAILQRLHAEYYLALAEATDPQISGGDLEYLLRVLESEHDNLRAALNWALVEGEAETLVRLSSALWYFWYERRHFSEGRRWLEAALSLGTEAQGAFPSESWAKALLGAGVLAYYQGDHARALELEGQSLALYRDLGEKGGTALALNNLGNLARDLGDYSRAESLFTESLSLFRELANEARTATVLNNLGLVAYDMGDSERAEQLFSESLKLRRRLGRRSDIAFSLHCLGEVARQQGKLGEASTFYAESLELCKEMGDKRSIAMNLHGLGMVALLRNELERAESLLKESLSLRRELGERRLFVWDLEGLAAVAEAGGQVERASQLLGIARALREAIGLCLPLTDATLSKSTTARIRAQLGEQTFQKSSAEGEQMALEEALTYALEES